MGAVRAVGALGVVGAVGAEGVWAHIGKPLNTSKTLARAARVVGSVGGWRGGGEVGGGGGGGVGLGTEAFSAWWAVGCGGFGAHWRALNTSKTLARRLSEDNGRGAVGAVREGGDDVEWVGKALTAVGAERVWNGEWGRRSAESGGWWGRSRVAWGRGGRWGRWGRRGFGHLKHLQRRPGWWGVAWGGE